MSAARLRFRRVRTWRFLRCSRPQTPAEPLQKESPGLGLDKMQKNAALDRGRSSKSPTTTKPNHLGWYRSPFTLTSSRQWLCALKHTRLNAIGSFIDLPTTPEYCYGGGPVSPPRHPIKPGHFRMDVLQTVNPPTTFTAACKCPSHACNCHNRCFSPLHTFGDCNHQPVQPS